jgi:L-fuconolactonase
MRIDAHQHFWRFNPGEYDWIDDSMASIRRDYLPADLRVELAKSGFDRSVAVQVRQTLDETRWLLALSDRHPEIAGVVGWVDLRADNVREQLETFRDHPRFVGVRHIVQSEPDDRFLLNADFCRGVGMLAEFGLTYDILVYERHLATAAEFVSRFPRQRFVLDHLGKPDIRSRHLVSWTRDLRALAKHSNVYAKLSGLVTEADWKQWTVEQIYPYLDAAFECFGEKRLMIGSDWPVCTLAADYARTMGLVTEYLRRLPDGDREAVLGGNAQRFWRLDDTCTMAARAAADGCDRL